LFDKISCIRDFLKFIFHKVV